MGVSKGDTRSLDHGSHRTTSKLAKMVGLHWCGSIKNVVVAVNVGDLNVPNNEKQQRKFFRSAREAN